MISEKHLKQKAQAAINAALKDFREGLYVEPSADKIYSDEYEKLDRLQSDQAVIAFILAANLSGGSVGDVDIYKLIRTYLWDVEARAKINDVVKTHEHRDRLARNDHSSACSPILG
ncbi:MAG TPA: hypothetical protein VIF82_19120 [Burkholderiaceae bacterium]|jgi:hypothetical protein